VRLRVREQVLAELVFAVESLRAQRAAERPPMHHAVLDQVRPGGEPFVAQVARVRPVAEVQVLMFHEDMLVAEASVAYRALVGLLADVREPDVPDQSVLVAELLAAQRALERAVVRRRRLGQQQQVGGRYLRRRRRRRDRLRSAVMLLLLVG